MLIMNKKYIQFIFLFLTLIIISLSGGDSQGFFLEDSGPKKAVIPEYQEIEQPQSMPTVTVTVNMTDTVTRVSPYIYGNNVNVYMTQMVTEPDLIHYIKILSPRVLRYPGGNLSNLFFWNALPGILPEGLPDILYGGVDGNYREKYWFGRDDDPERLSLDNYYKMLELTGCKGCICVNYSYGRYGTGPHPVRTAAKYAADWVSYDRGRTKFWEIGNENYGVWQAGYKIDITDSRANQPEIISGELYGKHFKIFADSMRRAAQEVGSEIKIGAVLLETAEEWHSPVEKDWNAGFFRQANNHADFYIIHSYYTPWKEDSSIPVILNSAARVTKKMMNFIQHVASNNGVEMKPLALTEWNIFATGSKQKVSYINGIHAVLVLGELIKNKYGMANRWNLANSWDEGNDYGMFSQGGEPGVPRWNPRPSFYYLTYFQKYFGDHMVSSTISGDSDIVVYASSFSSGEAGIIIVNKGVTDQLVNLIMDHFIHGKRYYYYSLTGGDDNCGFSLKVFVNGCGTALAAGGPADPEKIKAYAANTNKGILISTPPYSVQYILVERMIE
jgi:hypothetical protein